MKKKIIHAVEIYFNKIPGPAIQNIQKMVTDNPTLPSRIKWSVPACTRSMGSCILIYTTSIKQRLTCGDTPEIRHQLVLLKGSQWPPVTPTYKKHQGSQEVTGPDPPSEDLIAAPNPFYVYILSKAAQKIIKLVFCPLLPYCSSWLYKHFSTFPPTISPSIHNPSYLVVDSASGGGQRWTSVIQ